MKFKRYIGRGGNFPIPGRRRERHTFGEGQDPVLRATRPGGEEAADAVHERGRAGCSYIRSHRRGGLVILEKIGQALRGRPEDEDRNLAGEAFRAPIAPQTRRNAPTSATFHSSLIELK